MKKHRQTTRHLALYLRYELGYKMEIDVTRQIWDRLRSQGDEYVRYRLENLMTRQLLRYRGMDYEN